MLTSKLMKMAPENAETVGVMLACSPATAPENVLDDTMQVC